MLPRPVPTELARDAQHRPTRDRDTLAARALVATPTPSTNPASGCPRIDPELQALIRQFARENRRWGSMRILGELRSLGFDVSNSTVRRYRGTTADPSRQHWTTFYRNHGPFLAEALREAAIDGLRLALTWIASRLRLPSPERDTKPGTASARADVIIPGGTLAEADRVVARQTPSLAHARDGPAARQRAA